MAVGKIERVKMFLEDAESFLTRGSSELEEGIRLNDQLKIRDAAEKLWNAVVSATNALILYYLDVVPASHWERRKFLDKLEDEVPEVERLGFRDRYGARERYLHQMTFYDGIIDPEMLKKEVDKVRKYIDDVKKLITDNPTAIAR
ncbi:PaREP1 family protein [Vulcanisaeta sp. JCM 16161]|uniref:PaREP1 family protein n=1 Tax=Vulcanisaeta sp. JCM 16161 TaxID=1295372 RepID=UPI00406CEDDA